MLLGLNALRLEVSLDKEDLAVTLSLLIVHLVEGQ